MEAALAEASAKGYLGDNVFGSGKRLDVVLHRGAGRVRVRRGDGAAVEPGGLPGAAAAQAAFPAVSRGCYAKPDDCQQRGVDLQRHARDASRGSSWYKGFGTERSPGMRIFCLSGNVKRPGLYELPHATR